MEAFTPHDVLVNNQDFFNARLLEKTPVTLRAQPMIGI